MKIRNTFLSIILLALTAMLFSSCENDYRWEKAHLRSTIGVDIISEGTFHGIYDIDMYLDVYDVRDRVFGNDLRDVEFINGDLLIVADRPVDLLTLYVYGKQGERLIIELKGIRGGGVDNIFNEPYHRDFLYDVTQFLRRDGYVDVKYEGVSRSINGNYMDIDIYMDLNAYVRY